MTPRRLALVAAALLAFLPLPARAEDVCSGCKGAGWVNCPRHRAPVAFEIRHSAYLQFDCCLGLGCRPCPKCKVPAALAKYEKHRKDLEDWVRSRREDVDLALFSGESGVSKWVDSGAIRHAETENFRLVSTAPPQGVLLCDVPEGLIKGLPSKDQIKRVFPPEQWDWILLKRCEEAFKAYKEVFRNEGRFCSSATKAIKDMCNVAEGKYDIYLWGEVPTHLVCGRKFFGVSLEMGTYKHGIRMTVVVGNQPSTKDDNKLHRYLLHMVNHLFIEAYETNIGFDMPPWVPEGFAHYMEFKRFGDFEISCMFERETAVSIPGRLRDAVLKIVGGGKLLPVASVIQLNYNTMDTNSHLEMWSYFHYLVEGTDRSNFIKFIQTLKRTKNQIDSFKEAYGWSLIGLDEPWMEWVRKNYR